MTLTKNDVLRNRGDLSPFLVHLTRTGELKIFKELDDSLGSDTQVQIEAKASLLEIIANKRIIARSPFGYFNFKVPQGYRNRDSLVKRDWLLSVCFTETPLEHIYLQTLEILGRRLQFKPYGLAFKEEAIRKKNGNPIFYLQATNQNIRSALDKIITDPLAEDFKDLMPLIDGFGPPWYPSEFSPKEIDFRWEREWRIVGDFEFTYEDIAFGLCPTHEIAEFEALFDGQIPFVDPLADNSNSKEKLRNYDHLKNII